MDEGSGKIQEASAHKAGFIVMLVAIVESHVAAVDVKTPALQNKEGKGHGKVIQRGNGRRITEGSEAEHARQSSAYTREGRSERSGKLHPTG